MLGYDVAIGVGVPDRRSSIAHDRHSIFVAKAIGTTKVTFALARLSSTPPSETSLRTLLCSHMLSTATCRKIAINQRAIAEVDVSKIRFCRRLVFLRVLRGRLTDVNLERCIWRPPRVRKLKISHHECFRWKRAFVLEWQIANYPHSGQVHRWWRV